MMVGDSTADGFGRYIPMRGRKDRCTIVDYNYLGSLVPNLKTVGNMIGKIALLLYGDAVDFGISGAG